MNQPIDAAGLVAAPTPLADRVRTWATPLLDVVGADVVSLYVYGSALAEHFDPAVSDVNVLLVVRDLPFARLAALSRVLAAVKPASAAWRYTPVVLTRAQVDNSVNVFPMEFLDLVHRRALLHGTDVLAKARVRRENLRHQCEYELRAQLVALRQAVLRHGASPEIAQRLLVQATGSSSAVLRHLLTLRGEQPPETAEAAVAAVARAYNADPTAFEAPFAARRHRGATPMPNAIDALDAYLRGLEKLIAAVDAHTNV